MNESGGRRRQAERRRAEILDTALEVFAARGVEGASVGALSAAAGVAHGLMYYYFPSKDALLQAALERHYFLPELERVTTSATGRPLADVLREVVLGFAVVLREHQAVVQIMVREAPSNPAVADRLQRARQGGVRLLAELLATRVAEGELRPHNVEATARLLLFTVVAAHLAGEPPEAFLPTVVDTVLHGIAA